MATTSFSLFEPEVWDPKVDRFFKMALKAAPHFYDASALVEAGGKAVYIPKVGDNFTATAIGATTGEVGNTAVNDTSTQVTLDRWLGSKIRITDNDLAKVSRSYSLQREYAIAITQAVAQQADKELLANVGSIARNVNDTTTSLVALDLEEAISITESYYCPKDQMTWFFTPKCFWGEIMNISKYYNQYQFGKAVTPSGVLNTLYGIPVVVSSNLPLVAGSNAKKLGALTNRNTIAFAFFNLPGAQNSTGLRLTTAVHPGGHLRTDVTADIQFGDNIMNSYHGVTIHSTGA